MRDAVSERSHDEPRHKEHRCICHGHLVGKNHRRPQQLADVMADDSKAEDGLICIIDTDIVADQATGEVIPQEADNA